MPAFKIRQNEIIDLIRKIIEHGRLLRSAIAFSDSSTPYPNFPLKTTFFPASRSNAADSFFLAMIIP